MTHISSSFWKVSGRLMHTRILYIHREKRRSRRRKKRRRRRRREWLQSKFRKDATRSRGRDRANKSSDEATFVEKRGERERERECVCVYVGLVLLPLDKNLSEKEEKSEERKKNFRLDTRRFYISNTRGKEETRRGEGDNARERDFESWTIEFPRGPLSLSRM